MSHLLSPQRNGVLLKKGTKDIPEYVVRKTTITPPCKREQISASFDCHQSFDVLHPSLFQDVNDPNYLSANLINDNIARPQAFP